MKAKLDYDDFGRVASSTYPAPAGAAPLVVAQDYNSYGHVLTVCDGTTGLLVEVLRDRVTVLGGHVRVRGSTSA